MAENVLAVMAHPDDEAFGPGGTIALWAKAGAEITLVCVTDGGEPRRKKELDTSAGILGVAEVVHLGYADGSLCNSLYHEIAGKIQAVVDRVGPTKLLTWELRGVSGHLDHVAAAMITSYIFRENKQIMEIWYYCQLESRLYRPFYNRYFIYFPKGYEKEEVDEAVDTTAVWPDQVRAIKAHDSQKHDGQRIILARKLQPKREYFLVERR